MAIPHLCPVCNGTGNVPKGFYEGLNNATGIEECKTCKSWGIVWDYLNSEYHLYSINEVKVESNNPCDNCPNKNNKLGCFCSLPQKSITY